MATRCANCAHEIDSKDFFTIVFAIEDGKGLRVYCQPLCKLCYLAIPPAFLAGTTKVDTSVFTLCSGISANDSLDYGTPLYRISAGTMKDYMPALLDSLFSEFPRHAEEMYRARENVDYSNSAVYKED